jgi:hypothetical protein
MTAPSPATQPQNNQAGGPVWTLQPQRNDMVPPPAPQHIAPPLPRDDPRQNVVEASVPDNMQGITVSHNYIPSQQSRLVNNQKTRASEKHLHDVEDGKNYKDVRETATINAMVGRPRFHINEWVRNMGVTMSLDQLLDRSP